MAEGNVVEISDSDFESEVLKSDLPTLVDFWAPWCGPCKAIAPVIADMSKKYDGKVKFTKMNVDNNPETPSKFGVRAIPTLIFFKNGEVVDQVTGAVGKDQLTAMISK